MVHEMSLARLARSARPLIVLGAVGLGILLIGQGIPYFATSANVVNILIQAAIVAVAACGMTLVLLTAGIDPSVGGVISLVGVLEAVLMTSGTPWLLAVCIGLAAGGAIGLVNGLMVARLKLPSFIATFGTLGIASGLALYIADVKKISLLPDAFVNVGNGSLGGVPYLVLIALAVLALLELALGATIWGVWLRAVGDAPVAARLNGVRLERTLTSAYTASGVLAAGAGTLLAANLSTASPLQGEPYTLAAIAACVVGGVDLMGGRGRLWAAVIGTVFLAALRDALNLMGVQPFMQSLVIGCLIILAVFLTTRSPQFRRWAHNTLGRRTRSAT